MPERAGVVEWCAAGRPMPGEERSGDDALVLADADSALVAAVDGVGHGPPARAAAEVAIASVRRGPSDDVVALMTRCHAALHATRGAAVGLAVFRSSGTLTWLGLGNIAGRVVSAGGRRRPRATGWRR